jgi:hypothetical protein
MYESVALQSNVAVLANHTYIIVCIRTCSISYSYEHAYTVTTFDYCTLVATIGFIIIHGMAARS